MSEKLVFQTKMKDQEKPTETKRVLEQRIMSNTREKEEHKRKSQCIKEMIQQQIKNIKEVNKLTIIEN